MKLSEEIFSHPMGRRDALKHLAAGAVLLEPAWFDWLYRWLFGDPKLVVVFCDVTGSRDREADRQIYRLTVQRLVERLRPGDRVVVGLISETPMPRFAPVEDLSVPTGAEVVICEEMKELKRRLLQRLDGLIQVGDAAQTLILDRCLTAEQIIEADDRTRYWIVFLSDMIEESAGLNFSQISLDDGCIRRLIQGLRDQRYLPDLHGAEVFVSGASGRDSGHFQRIQAFWMEYFQQSGGICRGGMYSRLVPRFPPERRLLCPG